MTRNDNEYDDAYDDLMPESTDYRERALLFGTSLLATVGLTGFAVAQVPMLATLVPSIATIPHLLGASVFVFALGAGGFSMGFNHSLYAATKTQIGKVSSVYFPMVTLLAALVDAGAFHPRLAMVFVTLLCAVGILYAIWYGGSLSEFGRQNA